MLLAITAVSIVSVSYFHFAPGEGNYVGELKDADHFLEELNKNEGEAAKKLIGDTTARYSGDKITKNINLLKKISSTQYYWTLSNPYVSRFWDDMEMKECRYFNYKGYDERTTLVELAGVKYYVSKYDDGRDIPYGYKPVRNAGKQGYYFFENKYPLPLGYCYDRYINEDQWERFNAVQKQEIQMEAAYTSQTPRNGVPQYQKSVDSPEIPYEIICNEEGITRVKDGFVTTEGSTSATINFKSKKHTETYVEIKGFDFQPVAAVDLYSDDYVVDPKGQYSPEDWENLSEEQRHKMRREKRYRVPLKRVTLRFQSSDGMEKKMKFETGYSSFTSGRHDFIVNMGYHDEEVTSLSILFPKRGVYKVSDISIYSIPLDNYVSKAEMLRKNAVRDVSLKTNMIEGRISVDRPKILCMAIPYSDGWRAYDELKEGGQDQALIEELLPQHEALASLCADSINTIRMVTLYWDGQYHLLYAVCRIGPGNGSITDNVSQGGLVIGIDTKAGVFNTAAADRYGKPQRVHPASGTQLVGFQIPYWEETLEMIEVAAKRVYERAGLGYAGWDVAITPTGPVLVEGNNWPDASLIQICHWVEEKKGMKYLFEPYL